MNLTELEILERIITRQVRCRNRRSQALAIVELLRKRIAALEAERDGARCR